jgi:hypothetical protein
MKVRLDDVRIAFCNSLWVPEPFGGPGGAGEPAHAARFIIPPKHKAVKLLDDAIETVAKEKWKDKWETVLRKIVKEGDICFTKADYENSSGEVYDGFENSFSLGARSAQRPLVIDRDKTPLIVSDGRPYAGCYVNAQVDIWAQDNGFGKRVNAKLSGVQFVRDGDAFSGSPPAKPDDFDDLADQGEDDNSDLV